MFVGPLKPEVLEENRIRKYFVFSGTEIVQKRIENNDNAATYIDLNEGDVCVRIDYADPEGSRFAGIALRGGVAQYAKAYHIRQALDTLLKSKIKLHPGIQRDAQDIVDFATITPPEEWMP